MRAIEKVARLRRTRRALAKLRRPSTNARIDPGPLLDFVPKLQPRYERPDHLAPLADILERAPKGGIRAVISVPPRMGKTELVLASIVKHLLRMPWLGFMYLSYGGRLAQSKSAKARTLARYAGVQLDESSSSKAEWLTPEGGGLRASGIEQSVIGHGADVIIVDDPHQNRLEAESKVKRDNVWDLYTSTVESRIEPDGSIIVCQQRWHEDDLAGRCLRTGEFVEVNLPAIWPNGQPLWGKRWPVEKLLRRRKIIGEYDWVSQYEGKPMPVGGKTFADAILTDRVPTEGVYVIGVDLAHTARSSSDWSAAVVMCLETTSDGRTRITVVDVEYAQERLTTVRRDGSVAPGFNRRIAVLQSKYPGARTVWRIGGKEDVIAELMAGLRDSPVPIEVVPAITIKWVAAQPYAASWNVGEVYVLRAPWTETFVRQHLAFTGKDGDEDDLVDAGIAAFDELAASGPARIDLGGERPTAGLKRERYT